jgi:RNA-directed DNA polymerase
MSDETPIHPDVDALVEQLASFLLAEYASGRSLTTHALIARSARHFAGCSALIAAMRREIALGEELRWSDINAATLAARMRKLPQFEASVLAHAHALARDSETELNVWLAGESTDADERQAARVSLDMHMAALPRLKDASAFARYQRAPTVEQHFNPKIVTIADLARTLEISVDELDSAVRRSRQPRAYHLLIMQKRGGGIRLIEQPTDALRVLQRRILRHILNAATLHPAAHGFIRGRSALTHATLHTGKRCVLRLDIADFFTSITAGRVHSAFLRLGLPPRVATTLTALTTSTQRANRLREVLRRHSTDCSQTTVNDWVRGAQETLCIPHLPQGASSSPMLANWIAYRLDQRLSGLSAAWKMHYSRYADDLTFSTDEPNFSRARFIGMVRNIVASEGWMLNERKTLVMPQSDRQRVTGIVVNQSMNLCRKDFDALKAAVHRYATATSRDDAAYSQLMGRVAWLARFRPERANRLKEKLLAMRG